MASVLLVRTRQARYLNVAELTHLLLVYHSEIPPTDAAGEAEALDALRVVLAKRHAAQQGQEAAHG